MSSLLEPLMHNALFNLGTDTSNRGQTEQNCGLNEVDVGMRVETPRGSRDPIVEIPSQSSVENIAWPISSVQTC